MIRYTRKYSSKKKSSKKKSYKRYSQKKQQKKRISKKQLKKGGNVLGTGAYGCIIKPNMPCLNTSTNNKLISKLTDFANLTKMNQSDDYTIVSKLKLEDIIGYDKHFILPIERCYETTVNIIEKDIIKQPKDIDSRNLRDKGFINVIQNYGGEPFYKFIIRKNTLLEVLPYYCAIFEAIQFLNNNGIIHRDIKNNNIVISSNTYGFINNDSLKIIDFGYAGPINEILFNKNANQGLTNPIYIHNANDQLLIGHFIWPLEYAVFKNFEKNGKWNIENITDILKQTYYSVYKKYWLKSADEQSYKSVFDGEVDIINDVVNQINNIIDDNERNEAIKDWIFQINYKTDVFALGVLLKIDLERLLQIDKQNEHIINELISYILSDILIINSYHRHDINQAYINFKNICKRYNVDDIYLYSINDNKQLPIQTTNNITQPLFITQQVTATPQLLKAQQIETTKVGTQLIKQDIKSPSVTTTNNVKITQPQQQGPIVLKRTYTFDKFL